MISADLLDRFDRVYLLEVLTALKAARRLATEALAGLHSPSPWTNMRNVTECCAQDMRLNLQSAIESVKKKDANIGEYRRVG